MAVEGALHYVAQEVVESTRILEGLAGKNLSQAAESRAPEGCRLRDSGDSAGYLVAHSKFAGSSVINATIPCPGAVLSTFLGTRIALSFALAVCWSTAALASTDTIAVEGEVQVGSNYTDFGNLALALRFRRLQATERSRSPLSTRQGN